MSGKYDDIIDLPHHVSPTRPRMSRQNRAAQFSAFAALNGYEETIDETARETDSRAILDESEKLRINGLLQELLLRIDEQPEAEITYFEYDPRKVGGRSVTVTGCVVRIDLNARVVVLADGTVIGFEELEDIVLSGGVEAEPF